jgi:uncharacterized protein YndB with AHSA1/START domain
MNFLENSMLNHNTANREIVVTRVFNVPRELVFRVWTDPKHIAHWWGPKGFTNTIHEMDVKTGGVWLFTIHGPDGVDYPNKVVYIEVRRPERLVYQHGEEGRPDYFQVTVTFAAQDNQTKLSMQMLFKTAEERDQAAKKYGAVEGLNQNMDKLSEYLSTNFME